MRLKRMVIVVLILCLGYFIKVILDLPKASYRKKYNIKVSYEDIIHIKDELNIEHTTYQWVNGLKMINKPKILIFHHSAIKAITVEKIDELHKAKGWQGIGYHYFISKDGTIYEGRPEGAEGAHTIGKNSESIGICVEGNLEEEEITLNQIVSIENLSLYLCLEYDINDILQHKDFANTLCPGKNFPIDEIKNSVIDSIKNYK